MPLFVIGVYEPGGCRATAPQARANPSFFLAKAKFFGQQPAVKNEKKLLFFVFIKRKNGIHSV